MRSDQLQRLVQNIRTIANTDSFAVRRDNKSAEWKNQLLHYLSNEMVRNHLRCLQPFQYYGSNSSAGVYAFKVNLYADHIYLKVNTKTLEAVSFHYEEEPATDILPAHIATSLEVAEELQIIAEPFKAGGYQASFAVGSSVIVVQVYPEFKNGAHWIDADQYTDALEEMAKGRQRVALRKLKAFEKEAISQLMGSVKDYGILSYVEGQDQMQLISVCYDLWRKHPEERWIQDIALDFLLKQEVNAQKRFAEQLQQTM